ncbi:CapA family protein [Sporichthya polymorpha]|uniref:CapA family protein n=1 Tax=Sporichthya polymorpha TaxID=35751 RepID=UPI0003763ED1|nr:CapA family protein [Sporichthya polymorpha]
MRAPVAVVAVLLAAGVLGSVGACSDEGTGTLPAPAATATVPGASATPAGTTVREARLAIVGDVMLGRRVGAAIRDDPAGPLRPTATRLAGADLTIGTFESTLSRLGRPTQGEDSFSADPAVLDGLELAGFDLLSLANNHVGDFGARSLVDTVRRLRAAGFATVGAGADAADAREPVVLEANGLRVGVLAFNAIGETPRVGERRPGAVTLAMQPRLGDLSETDLRAMTDAIRDLDARTDAVLVLPHWGEQYTHVPVRDQRRVARALVAAGADLVVGSHPHVVQAAERIGSSFVAYSLGNFVFDMDFSVPTQQGVILEVTLRALDGDATVDRTTFVPYRIGADFAPRVLDRSSDQGRAILRRIWGPGSVSPR